MLKLKKVNLGFTIVELLVVIVVIGILAAITVVSYKGVNNKAIFLRVNQMYPVQRRN